MEFDITKPNLFKPKTEREADIVRSLKGRYQFIQNLGEGSFSTVYVVINKSLDRVEALKVLSDDLTRQDDFLDRFQDEARISASFAHPNIVTVYEYKKINTFYYFTMFYVDGPPLSNFLNTASGMSTRRACSNIATVCDAIHYAHQRGVVHRDLTAYNIVLDQSGKPYVTDFGIAKWEKSLTRTQTGLIMGSPHYVSPEQAQGFEIDARADIYSLGITLYALLTHHYPFRGDTPHLTIANRLSRGPTPPETYKPDLAPELKKILDKALQKNRRNRYQTADEMAVDLYAFVQSKTCTRGDKASIAPQMQALPIQPKKPATIHKWLIFAVVIIAITVAMVFFLMELIDSGDKVEWDLASPGLPAQPADHRVNGDPIAASPKNQAVSDDLNTAEQKHHNKDLNKLQNKLNIKKLRDDYAGHISIIAPTRIHLCETIRVEWQGPGRNLDEIQVFDPTANGGDGEVLHSRRVHHSSADFKKRRVFLPAPGKEGTYQLRYWNYDNKVALAACELEVTK